MSYQRFLNLKEMLQADLLKKLTKGVKLMDFKVLECNCRGDRGGVGHSVSMEVYVEFQSSSTRSFTR
jgi:hypothetical protein